VPTPRISLIAAIAENGVIGINNALPWHLPTDLKRFRTLTSGHHVIMGRRTCESLGRPLPGRINLVVSRNLNFHAEGLIIVRSVEAALSVALKYEEVFVVGGASLYGQVLPRADHIYLTVVHAEFTGDTHFPDFNRDEWRELERVEHAPDPRHVCAYSFLTLVKKNVRGEE
jgi:dihydrofolate reductase